MKTPLGSIEIICDENHLLGLKFVKTQTARKPNSALEKKVIRQLTQYFAGRRKKFDLPISFEKLKGTAFQKRAWQELLKIPFGKTISYGLQAKKMKNSKACRAVGTANGKNPLPIIIPCHRVIAGNGALGGYSSGLWRKKVLLQLEGINNL